MEYERYKSERNVRIEVGSRWRRSLSGSLLLALRCRCIVALADQVDAVHPQLQIRLALMLACGQLPAHGDLLALGQVAGQSAFCLSAPNATVNPDGLLLVAIACGHGYREAANSRVARLPYFCVAAQVASQ